MNSTSSPACGMVVLQPPGSLLGATHQVISMTFLSPAEEQLGVGIWWTQFWSDVWAAWDVTLPWSSFHSIFLLSDSLNLTQACDARALGCEFKMSL